MIKRTLIAMFSVFLMTSACALPTQNRPVEGSFVRHLLPCAVRLDVHHEIKGNKFQTKGSGTIVHRELSRDGVYFTYSVLSCSHLYRSPKTAKIKIVVRQFDHRGLLTMKSFDATDVWIYNKKKADVAIVKFKSALAFRTAPLVKHVPSDLFGRKAMVLGCPFGRVPLITYGTFGVNHPTPNSKDYIGMRLWVAGGNSGSGVYLFNAAKQRWEIMGVLIAYYGSRSYNREGTCSLALRLNVIRKVLRQKRLLHLIGE